MSDAKIEVDFIMLTPIAHIKKDPLGNLLPAHDLLEHLLRVAELAKSFAESFGNGDWAELSGLWHDLGKYKPAFQKYLLEQGSYESLEISEVGDTGKQHAIVGALQAILKGGEDRETFARVLSYLIAGHHTGLPDWNHEMGTGGALSPKLKDSSHLDDALKGSPPREILEAEFPTSTFNGEVDWLHLWIRMLFSCLVDADFLDTENYMDPERSSNRQILYPSIQELSSLLDQQLDTKMNNDPTTPVNSLRKLILKQCQNQSTLEPGLFTLTVPTGGGKTLSGMAFALQHALIHGKRRVIVAIPYTSIIEQTAKVYRDIFGDQAVLEHHSNLDPAKETETSKLAAENWDAPIIITTNVQLFESLFAARTSQCRKLHNIVNSVIILDEVQVLPTGFLNPILRVLEGLTESFGCSVVLSTATQPVFIGDTDSGRETLKGFPPEKIREIVPDTGQISEALKRVRLERFKDLETSCTWQEVAEALIQENQVLCIVNSRKDCRELFDLMPKGTIHLSALMCPEHRTEVINNIKEKLKAGQPLRVISTQLVESGVDLDFPVVFRAMAGFDSIAQAAGRCNREGRLPDLGRTVVFKPSKDAPAGLLRKGQDAGEETLRVHPNLAKDLSPEVFKHYFQIFYSKVNSFDEKGIGELLAGPNIGEVEIQFRTAAQKFQLIEGAGQVSVITHYRDEVKLLVNSLERVGPYRELMRKLQRFTVSVPERSVLELVKNGYLRPVKDNEKLFTQVEITTQGQSKNIYSPVYGLSLEGPAFSELDFVY